MGKKGRRQTGVEKGVYRENTGDRIFKKKKKGIFPWEGKTPQKENTGGQGEKNEKP